MPYDVVAANRQAVQSGLALGRAMFDNSLRMQELQSREALRRLEEQQRAQKLAFDLEAHNLQVQERADMEKAAAAIQAESMLTMPQFGPPEAGQGALPDVRVPQSPSAETIVKHTLPVVMKYRPREVDNFLANTALYESRQALAQESGPGAIQTVQGPGGQQLQVYVPPRGRGANQIVGTGEPRIIEQGGRQFYIDAKNNPRPLGQDIEGRQMRIDDLKRIKELRPDLLDWDETRGGFVLPERNAEAAKAALAAGGTLTAGDRSDLKQSVVKLTDTASRFQPLIENADRLFGPKAIAGTVVVDRMLANLNPKWAVGDRIQGREAARYAVESMVRSLTQGQGALSDRDVKRIQALFPELGRIEELVAENPTRAANIFKSLQKQLARDAITNARILGDRPTIDALRFADPAYLVEEWRLKHITDDELKQAINQTMFTDEANNLVNALRNGR